VSASGAKPLKCPSCGAPLFPKAGALVVECDYCGSRITIGTRPPPPPSPTTIIIETRHRHVHRHRLRRLFESAWNAGETVNSVEGMDHEER